MVLSTAIYGQPIRVATAAVLKASKGTLWAVLLEGGTAASSIDFMNDGTGSATATVGVTAPFTDADASSASTVFIDFSPLGGIKFDTGIYGKIAGTAAVAYVWIT